MFKRLGMFDRSLGMFQPLGKFAAVFTPAELFASGEQGTWYDPSDGAFNWRRNLLTYTEDFRDTTAAGSTRPWTNTAINAFGSGSVANTTATIDPIGTNTADYIQENTDGSTGHVVSQSITIVSGVVYTIYCYFKAAQRTIALLRLGGTPNLNAFFNLSTGNPGTVSSGLTASMSAAGNGWYKCSITWTSSVTGSQTFVFGMAETDGTVSYTGNGTSGIYIWGAQLEAGSTATAYQQIVTPEISYLTYDPDPVLFQDSAGTLPVTAVEQPIGLMLDKSQGLVLGPELVTNGDFTSNVDSWSTNATTTKTWDSGTLLVQGGVGTGGVFQDITFTGYIKFTIRAKINTGALTLYVYNKGSFSTVQSSVQITNTSYTEYTGYAVAATGGARLYFQTVAIGTSCNIDFIRCSVIAGNHAYQSTTTSRPILRNLYNQLQYTEQFDNAAWNKTIGTQVNVVTPNTITAPDGATTADTLAYQAAASSWIGYQSSLQLLAGTSYTFRIWIKRKAGTATIQLNINPYALSWVTVNVTSDWQLFEITQTSATTTTPAQVCGILKLESGSGNEIYIWGASLVPANEASIPYQRVVTNTLGSGVYDSDVTKFPPYLYFDGTDDWMQTGNINFSATDTMSVFFGVRKLVAGTAIPIELGPNINNVDGTFQLVQADTSTGIGYGSRGSSIAGAVVPTSGFTAPITSVVTGLSAISTDYCVLRVSGVQVASTATDQGTGNYASAQPLYIGARYGTTTRSLFFFGRIYSLITRGALTTTPLLEQTESWVATKTGVTL